MKRLAVFGLTCALAGLLAPALAGGLAPGQVGIELRPEVTAARRAVTLGEIAYLRTPDMATMRRLIALPLGEAPRAGGEAILHRDALARWIRMRTGIGPERIVWTGPGLTAIRAFVQRVPSAHVEQTARVALQQWLQPRTTRFSAQSARPIQEIDLPPGNVKLTARPLPFNAQPASRMVVWVDVEVDGAFIRTVPVSFQVEAYRDAWVASTTTGAEAPLSAQLLETREVAVTVQPVALLTPIGAANATGRRSTRRLRPGEPLTEDNTRQLAAVARGEMVALQFKAGAVRLEGRAQALQEGEPGEVVRVRMTGASMPVQARVLERGRVEAMP